MLSIWLLYLFFGVVAGIMAGLLGVGGGIILVPMLTYVFTLQQFPPQYVHSMALGTSLAIIMFTSFSSLRTHHSHGAVNWQVFKGISPGIIIGTLAGSWLAAQLSTGFMKMFFIGFIYYVSVQMLLDIRPKTTANVSGFTALSGAGSIIGVVSSLVGIGGGTMSVPFLQWCGFPFRSAIGTSAAIGFPIAVSGTIGYILNGYQINALPPLSIGFVYVPAMFIVASTSFLAAPIGARLTHTLPVPRLKKIFALFLVILGTRMLIKLL